MFILDRRMITCSKLNELTITNLKVTRPAPIQSEIETLTFRQGKDVELTINALLDGKFVLVEGVYNNGLVLLFELQKYLKKTFPNETFKEQRAYRSEFQKRSNQILVEVNDHKLVVKKSPEIGWLKKLYPELNDFILPFTQIQGLNSAWQWYKKGISIPGLRNKIHPYYGTYFPTRFEHLVLFDNWLKKYKGAKKSAIDVGVGSGVLSLLMVKHGFQKVFGTDTNSNAIIGLSEFMGETKLSRKIELDYGHLFGKWEKPRELIVFNPPWLPASYDLGRNDRAIYYDENLFPEFFHEAKKRLLPNGKLVLIFSNLAQITNVAKINPIEKEIAEGGRYRLELCIKRPVKSASNKTTRNQHWRSSEEVELWVLRHK